LYKRAIALLEKALGPEDADVSSGLNNLATLYMDQARYPEAEPLAKRALAIREKKRAIAIYEKAFGPEHPDLGAQLGNQARLYQAQGRYAEAEPLYQRALTIQEKVHGSNHETTEATRRNLQRLRQLQNLFKLPTENPGVGAR
jgi:tetratricopeptide (TPR) repeat protein